MFSFKDRRAFVFLYFLSVEKVTISPFKNISCRQLVWILSAMNSCSSSMNYFVSLFSKSSYWNLSQIRYMEVKYHTDLKYVNGCRLQDPFLCIYIFQNAWRHINQWSFFTDKEIMNRNEFSWILCFAICPVGLICCQIYVSIWKKFSSVCGKSLF